jgi:hypothetical protein
MWYFTSAPLVISPGNRGRAPHRCRDVTVLEPVFAARRLSAPWALCPSTTQADVVRE